MQRGKFITLEGIDGAGKSTHMEWLRSFLEARGMRVTLTREPGGTPLGESLRELLLDPGQSLHPESEARLMFAARREHLDKVILPALDRKLMRAFNRVAGLVGEVVKCGRHS